MEQYALKDAIPQSLRWEVWERDDFKCHYCGTRRHLALDHKIPESQGGLTIAANLLTACGRCNSRKGTKSYEAFIKELTSDPIARETVSLPEILENGKTARYTKTCEELTIGEAELHLRTQSRRLTDQRIKHWEQIAYLTERFGQRLRSRLDGWIPGLYRIQKTDRITGRKKWVYVETSHVQIKEFTQVIRRYIRQQRPEDAMHAYKDATSRWESTFPQELQNLRKEMAESGWWINPFGNLQPPSEPSEKIS